MDFDALELELKRSTYKESYYEFFKWAFELLHSNEPFEDNFHIRFLCELLDSEQKRIERREENSQDLIINIPPRTSKSLICSVIFNAWVWTRNPAAKFLCISYDDNLSILNAQLCKDIITSAEYQELFGDVFSIRADSKAKSFYFTNKGGYRLSKTVGGNITGFSGLYIILDDPQNPKTAISKPERLKVNSYFTQSLYNRLTPASLGLRMVVMQRLHEDDLTGHLLKNDKTNHYRHICLPAELSDKVKPVELKVFYRNKLLDPGRLSVNVLNGMLAALGSKGYAGQYSQVPAKEEGNMVKRAWMKIVQSVTITRDHINEPICFAIDPAYTSNEENDPSAIMSYFVKDNKLYILDVLEVWMEFHDLINFIKLYVMRMGYNSNSRIFVEPKASGKSIVQQLIATTMLNVLESKPPDTDKVARLNSKLPILETGRVILIDGPYVENFLNQLCTFPNSEHDDMVDVLVIGITESLEDNNPAIAGWV
jgi:predicted phage terminase large subunit-like protein